MKNRLDKFLHEKAFYASREKSKEAIECGRVKVDGKVVTKASFDVSEDAVIDCLPFEFVSRGGFKLQKALEEFGICVKGKRVLDIGASTGGFCDVVLQGGAESVVAVDTGSDQLAQKIKDDARVTSYEKTNFFNLQKEKYNFADLVVIDVSFVSLQRFAAVLAENFDKVEVIALVKPQFECGAVYAKKHKGIVKDSKMHDKICKEVTLFFENAGFEKHGLIDSPILGGDGNKEFLLWLKK